jgi:hypothetical protein
MNYTVIIQLVILAVLIAAIAILCRVVRGQGQTNGR